MTDDEKVGPCAESSSGQIVGMSLGDPCPRCRHLVGVHALTGGCVVCRLEQLEAEWRGRLDALRGTP